MKITQIKQQMKNPERVSVFVDGAYSFSLTLDQLLAEKLKKHIEIDSERVKQLINLSDEGKLRARALEWLIGRPHSTREFRDYLYRKKVETDLIEQLIEEFSEKKYLNDENFARWFVELHARKNKSARAIKAELASKGISPYTIQSVVTELGVDYGDKEALIALVNKLRKRARYSNDERKLITYLAGKGFSYSAIKEAIAASEE